MAGGADVPEPVQILAVIAVIFAARLASPRTTTDRPSRPRRSRSPPRVGSIFIDLYPSVMVSSTNTAYNLTVNNSASGSYALKVMTIAAVIFFPLVLLYQGWSFHVFRARVKAPPAPDPIDAAPRRRPPRPALRSPALVRSRWFTPTG